VGRELAWRRADARALELDPPADLVAVLGPLPAECKARQAWRVAAGQVDGYRRAYGMPGFRLAEHVWGRGRRGAGRVADPRTWVGAAAAAFRSGPPGRAG
jgi:hypothetical protein